MKNEFDPDDKINKMVEDLMHSLLDEYTKYTKGFWIFKKYYVKRTKMIVRTIKVQPEHYHMESEELFKFYVDSGTIINALAALEI